MAQRSRNSKRRQSRKQNGGNHPDPSSYSSASTYGSAIFGNDVTSQLSRVGQGMTITGMQGQRAGAKKRTSSKKSKRGGFWGQMISQAVVPMSLLGMQQTFRRKRRSNKYTRRHR